MTSLICRFSCICFLCMISSERCLAICILANIYALKAGSWRRREGGNIAKQLKASNMSGCIQKTPKNITIKDTAYIIERERNRWDITQTKTDKRKILSSGNILKPLQWHLMCSLNSDAREVGVVQFQRSTGYVACQRFTIKNTFQISLRSRSQKRTTECLGKKTLVIWLWLENS